MEDPLGFFNIHSVEKHQKTEEEPFGEKTIEKSLTMPKDTERGNRGIACYAEKKNMCYTSVACAKCSSLAS